MKRVNYLRGLLLPCFIVIAYAAHATDPGQTDLDQRLRALKTDFVSLARQMDANTAQRGDQILLGVGEKSTIALQSVALQLAGQTIYSHQYLESENRSLAEGGLQTLVALQLPRGQHDFVLQYTGTTPDGENFRQAASFSVSKAASVKVIELTLKNRGNSEPSLSKREYR